MKGVIAAIAAITWLGAASSAFAIDLTTEMKGAQDAPQLTMNVGCGNLQKANCDTVLPKLNYQVQRFNISMNPARSQGSVQTAQAVCKGIVEAGVGQLDAVLQVIRDGRDNCGSAINLIGPPLYPYYVQLYVRADSPYSSFDQMIRSGKPVKISAGAQGSGGNTILDNHLRVDPGIRDKIEKDYSGIEEAMGKIMSGQLDAYLIADGPKSAEVDLISAKKGEGDKPAFKAIDYDPPSAFFNLRSLDGRTQLYHQATIKVPGWFTHNTRTVQVNAVFFIGSKFQRINSDRLSGLDEALVNAVAGIRNDVGVPGWTPQQE